MTTIKVSTETRDRLRAMFPDATMDDAVNAACDALADQQMLERLDAIAAKVMTVHGEALDRLGR
ncbi:MAG: hypothetical protein R2770_21710 [Acidimicrobiales bacterium]